MAMERSRVCVALHAPDFESQNNKPLGRNSSTRDQVLGTNSRARDKNYLVAYLIIRDLVIGDVIGFIVSHIFLNIS